ncbi:probable inactive serine/threonine-protein kinase scy2 [Vigna unguiculata]|uniref:probable inactive serine/threonine-protein kinase scy2 n=1 Tax=Vigna unguiculata TaxID=3917 RepID=UPI0010165023|nr:probable inactive serine/threonine-protein kinase scy2 [Vigna unguiculata]
MDSANTSGSLQSSSGADEEYDSRAQSSQLSAFLNNPTQPPSFNTAAPNNLHPLIPPPHHHHQNTHIFDPLSTYLDPITQTSTSLLNLDVMWSKPGRSEPNQPILANFIPCSSSSPSPHNQAFLSTQTRGSNNSAAFPTLPPEGGSRGLMLSVSAANNDQIQTHSTTTNSISTNNNNTNVVRNPKKRSRASRRAPTTVLTTDTTNFRAMVQEFTGIPAPPFTSSPFPRTRLDLFASAATPTLRSNLNVNVNPLDPPTPPPYLLRPFPQKLQFRSLHPFPPSLSNTLSPSTNSTTNSTSINYQQQQNLSEHFGLMKQPLNYNNAPTLEAYQHPRYALGNSSVLVSRPQQQPSLEIPPSLKMGVFEELGLRHECHVNTDLGCLHQNMVSSTSVGVGALSSGNNNSNNLSNANPSTEWAQRTGTITNNDCDHAGGGGGGALTGTVSYSDIAERVTNGKVHYPASSSDFHGEKGPEFSVTARSQGMVESWINCSSD